MTGTKQGLPGPVASRLGQGVVREHSERLSVAGQGPCRQTEESWHVQGLVLGELGRPVTALHVVTCQWASGRWEDGIAGPACPSLDPTRLRWLLPLLPGQLWPGPSSLALPVRKRGICLAPLDDAQEVRPPCGRAAPGGLFVGDGATGLP